MYIVTGGGSGLGRGLAQELARRDQDVLIIGRNLNALQETASYSSRIGYFQADVSSEEGRASIAAYVQSQSALRGLVHNAGIIDPIIPIKEMTTTAWHTCMATNVEAPLFLTQLLQEKLLKGRVLHIGSGAAHFPIAGWSAYCVSKAALSMLTRCLQLELHDSISFANVMPGIVDTNMQGHIREAKHMTDKKRNFFVRLKRDNLLLSSETVALFLTWLLLDASDEAYVSQEWDIYDKTHHPHWLPISHFVPEFE